MTPALFSPGTVAQRGRVGGARLVCTRVEDVLSAEELLAVTLPQVAAPQTALQMAGFQHVYVLAVAGADVSRPPRTAREAAPSVAAAILREKRDIAFSWVAAPPCGRRIPSSL